jgi:peptidoglycan/xylan/chitin deacetylase (PgdA/CDA1 family)
MKNEPKILLSFDVEEFDLPLEYGQSIAVEEQLQVGFRGLEALLPLLQMPSLQTTLFTTAFFASHYPDVIRQLSSQHEIASHTFYHTRFQTTDLLRSKEALEKITGKNVVGLRMPRMKEVDAVAVRKAGYSYNSSINPTWIPGRYNNLSCPRKPFVENGLLQVPVSVTSRLRIPLFWLAFKNFPYAFYLQLARRTLQKDGYLLLYFHPWEFTDLSAYALPGYVARGSRQQLLHKLSRLIEDLSSEGEFCSLQDFLPVV